jgi:hypothetical protein
MELQTQKPELMKAILARNCLSFIPPTSFVQLEIPGIYYSIPYVSSRFAVFGAPDCSLGTLEKIPAFIKKLQGLPLCNLMQFEAKLLLEVTPRKFHKKLLGTTISLHWWASFLADHKLPLHCSPDMKNNLEWSLTILARVAKKYCLLKSCKFL